MTATGVLSSGWRFLTIAAAALVMATGVFGDRPSAQQLADTTKGENFDIRSGPKSAGGNYLARVAADASFSAKLATAREEGVARLRADYDAIDLENSPLTGTLEIVGTRPGTGVLTPPSADRVDAMRGFLSRYADAYGLSAGQVQELELVGDYANPAGNMAWVEFEQMINGIPVFQGLVRGGFTKDGELARITGPLASGLDAGSLPVSPSLSATTAVSLAASHVGWNVPVNALVEKSVDARGQRVTFDKGTMADDAKAWPVYFPVAPGVARLAWATEIWGDPEAFLVVLDAQDGTVLFRKNLTNYQTQSATYNVYNDDSPAPMSPSTTLPGLGTQAPFISRSTITLIGNEAPNTFNNLGWMTDGLNETDGNNVRAGLDLVAPDGIEGTVAGSGRVFNFSYNPQTDDPATVAYRNGEVTDMFYWTNRYHDSLYLLGFNEAARNFQNDNFGRGGAAGDKIRAEAQDFSGTNNANFSTPSDGGPGRMQMYIFTGPAPDRTSGIDHDVVLHELTHGTSNRLHNNATGLATQVSAGMGEGWSDFYARALLSSASEDVNGIYSTGGWVTNQISPGFVDNYYYGIRRFPYAVKTTVGFNGKPHNPLTLADIDPTQINLSDGAFSPAFVGFAFEVHNIGEVWCMALLEARARFITRLGFAVGNQRFLQFVTDGMKLDPTNPTPLQGRNSILAAAAAGGGTAADTADIWAGFAARGMGVQATFDPFTFAAGESFNVPGTPLPSVSINNVSVNEGNSGTTMATFTATLSNPEAMLSPARVTWTTADGSATAPGTTLTASGPITVPLNTSNPASSPYPLNLTVGGLPTSTGHVKVRLNSFTHAWPSDVDVLLVGPGGQKVMLMSDVGGFSPGVTGLNLTFDDGAPRMPLFSPPVTGTYAPTDVQPDSFPAPAPAGPYGTSLSVFSGTNPNGTWSLYVADDFPPSDSGSIGSFSLIFSAPTDDYLPSSGQLIFPVGSTTQTVSVPINGDSITEGNETFFVNLSQPISVGISVAQGVGTILNDDGSTLPPTVVTGVASNVTATSAVLNGTVNPNGSATTANFEYGPTTGYGSATSPQAIGSGNAVVPIGGGAIGGLTCNTTYHFRATATSARGTTTGSDAMFTTSSCSPPTVTTTIPTGFTATGATLNGTANPNGLATNAWFEYGLTTAYGSSTPVQTFGAGGVAFPIGGGTVSGLACDTVYHFRARATNALGTTLGADQQFSPPCAGAISPSLLAVANDTGALRVFNASTLAPVATIPVPLIIGNYDVVVTPTQSLAFAARSDGIWVVDLTLSPPALAAGLNPIPTPTGMPFVEDLSLTRDGRFLVASDGSAASPIAVIDTTTRAVVGTTSVLADHNSVEVCDNGSVLVTSFSTSVVRRLTISDTGALTDTGQSLTLPGAGPNNTVCGPRGTVGVVVNRVTGDLQSFIVNGMTAVSTLVLPGSRFGINVAISRDGTKLFGRGAFDNLTAYAFNSTTGVIGAQLWSTNIGPTPPFYGVDQIGIDPSGSRVFATTSNGFVMSLNASTGAINGGATAVSPTGMALKRGTTSTYGDYDGDGKDDISVYRPSTGTWYVKESTGAFIIQPFGLSTDIPLRGDYDGDGKADVAIYRPSTSTWYVLKSSTNFTTAIIQQWGLGTDIPVPGDYDGDGKTDPAVFRPSTGVWYILQSSSNYTTYIAPSWGLASDVLVPGDFDGDGKTDPAVFRPSTGTWYLLQSSTNYATFVAPTWGLNTDITVPGDYDGDGKADPAVYRPSTGTWYLLQSSTNYTTSVAQTWGLGTDVTVPGDYDGDGKTDPAVFRPSTGVWYILLSGAGYTNSLTTSWGLSTDVPVLQRP